MTKRFFVTGTDTEVGKTIASSALLQAANLLGFHTAGYKPVPPVASLPAMGCVMKMRWRCSIIVGSRCVTTR